MRGLGGDVGGGGASDILLLGGVLPGGSGRTSGTAAEADVLEEFDFCRLCGGEELGEVSPVRTNKVDVPAREQSGRGAD